MRVRRPFVGVVTAAALVLGGLEAVAQPALAAPPPPASNTAAEADDTERPDLLSAQMTARTSGHRVLVTGMTDETSRTFANPDGTLTSEIASEPVRVHQDGAWTDIDTTLVSDESGVHATATDGVVSFPTGGTGSATVTREGRELSMRWLGALPDPTLAGDTATYANALPEGDLTLTALASGFEASVVLHERPADNLVLHLPVDFDGLTASEQSSGAVLLKDAAGATIGSLDTPRMWGAGGESDAVVATSDLIQTPNGPELTLTPDPGFLATAELPITIDPTVSFGVGNDTMVDSANPTINYSSGGQLHAGRWNAGSVTRSYVTFGTLGLASKHVTNATFKIWNYSAQACSGANSALYKVTSAWTASTMTWNTGQPTVDASVTATNGGAHGYTGGGSTCTAQDWLTFSSASMTSLVQGWADGSITNRGVQLAGPEGTGCTACAKGFRSNDYVTTSVHPVMEVTYNSYPASVWGRSQGPGATYGTTSYVTSRTPTLHGVAADADGGQTRIDYEIWNDAKTSMVVSGSSAFVGQGTDGAWNVPSGSQLTEGTAYQWRAKGHDGTDASKAYNTWLPFTVDATAPAAATVSSTAYPAGTWSGTDGQAGSFTFAPNGATDLGGYYYWLDDAAQTFVAATGSTSVSLSPAEGSHTLSVQSADKAGNRATVTTYAFSVGQLGIASPVTGKRIEQSVSLSATARPAQWTSLTWKWRRSEIDSWSTITTVTRSDVSQPFPAHTWNVASTLLIDGPFELKATASDGTNVADSQVRPVSLDRSGNDSATESMGPGVVNLSTGNLQISANDVSVSAVSTDLTVGRSYNSRSSSAGANGPFGPGWVSSVPVVGASAVYTSLAASGSLATVTLVGGTTIGFTKKDQVGGFTSEFGEEELTLTYVSASDRYDLKDEDGNVTSFTKPTGATTYVPTTVTQSGDTSSTSYSYETVTVGIDTVTRVTGVMAPAPSGVTGCSLTAPSAVIGCRSLKMTYAPSSTSPPTGGQTGDYPDRLQKVELVAYDADQTPTPGMRTLELAHYAYNPTGQLAEAWDPRLSGLKTTYTYNAAGQVATMTPPAEETWAFAYADLTGEGVAGRLRSVTRATLTSPSTATTTIVYNVPVSGSGAPWNLSPTELDRTGQVDRPATATAIFAPDTSTSLGTDPNSLPGAWHRAEIHYLDADGREVNTADEIGAITTSEHDGRGATVRSLSAGNRQRALDEGTSTASEASIAERLTTRNIYTADGVDLLETFGPEHDTMLSTGEIVRAREHTVRTYDEGSPGGVTYHLVTTVSTGARVSGESTDRATETRSVKTEYGTTTASWDLGQPTASIIDAVGGGLNLATRMTYLSDGRIDSSTLPAGGTTTNTAATRLTRYYTAGTNGTDAACGNKPEWADRICAIAPGGQPATGSQLPTTYTTYDMFNQPRVVTEKVGGTTLRTTTTTYDTAGREWKSSITASTGSALPTVETYYDNNGRATETRSLDGTGAITARVTRVYNTLGQLTSYTDTDGTTSTTTYDELGRPLVTADGKGTQTRTYDPDEPRGLVTSLVDSHAGTFTAAYDIEGTPTVDWPNGIRATSTIDEIGSQTGLDYTMTSGCTGSACLWLSFAVDESIHGQWLKHSSTQSQQAFAYDGANRLSKVEDTVAGDCTTRKYTYDAGNGNRTKLETFDPGTDGACQATTAASTVNSTYDTADRLTASGTVYDTLGRTTTVPDASALDTGALTVAYHVNDLVASISQSGGSSKTYTLDVDQQRVRSWTDAGVTHTNHYDGDGDNPSWTQESATAWTRAISGITGDLAGIYDSATSTATLQLTNLHGDVVATASTSTSAGGPASTFEATEFGTPRGATGTRYGWLGGKQRAADTPGGLSLMGVRLYNPATGRFLQTDPVYGGSANPYDYANQDPLNTFDLDGRRAVEADGCSARCEAAMNRHYVRHPYQAPKPPKRKCNWFCRHKKGLGSLAKVLATVSFISGLVPAAFCQVCALVSAGTGYAAAGFYRAAGNKRAAVNMIAITTVGLVAGRWTRVGRHATRFARAGSYVVSRTVTYGFGVKRCGPTPWC
ncbi:MAG: hypothetical protein QOE45_3288 [Frankiaceae bacterium]|jgi:RHS repeat-associated protein|nr:hypothetical protein [Frankiaceae bacterium]